MPSVIPDKISDFEMNITNKQNTTPQPIKFAGDVEARIDKFFLLIAAFWTIVILVAFELNYRQASDSAMAIAQASLLESYHKDLVYRRWAAIHGGVYVPVDSDTPPNPYLDKITERDIETPSGKRLTLMNPAYMTRQVQELAEKQYGHKGHITSLKPLRPENAPDEWESKALLAFEQGQKEISSFGNIGDKTYLRFMRPFVVEQSCLKCHGFQGYKVGDIRGGISVSTPWEPIRKTLFSQMRLASFEYGGIWFLGILGLLGGRRSIKKHLSERKIAEAALRESERKLLHAQKLESLGMMAGGIAHDFNNQLAVVLGNLELALMDLPADSVVGSSIKNAIQAANRSAELSRQMLTYSGSAFYVTTDLDLSALLDKQADMFRSAISTNITLNLQINKCLPLIRGDADQILRLVMNLVVNASEAIGDQHGEVTLATDVMDCDAEYLSRSRPEDKPGPGRFVFLEITDTGCGMDSWTLDRLFDPFFSTKFWGRGLGMAEVIGIIKGHHGAIVVESESGKGTTIRGLFPVLGSAG
jgi:signal transduction histidine kinase